MVLDQVTIGSYPRDDVWTRWTDDGLTREGRARIWAPQDHGASAQVGEVTLGGWDVVPLDLEPGAQFQVELNATFGAQSYSRWVTFTATADESGPAYVAAVGPGAVEVPSGRRFKKPSYSGFVFGILVLAATTEQGTRCPPGIGALVTHADSDGVGPA